MIDDQKVEKIFRLMEQGLAHLAHGFTSLVTEIEKIHIRLERLEQSKLESLNGKPHDEATQQNPVI